MSRQVLILGATGSIGASTLKVLRNNPEAYDLYGVTGARNVAAMLDICREFSPQYAVMADPASNMALMDALRNEQLSTEVLAGEQAIAELAKAEAVDLVMAAIVGAAGLLPTLAAVEAGKTVLLANKEALVMSGAIFMDAAARSGAQILPVDSEHNAIFQCMPQAIQQALGHCDLQQAGVSKILLTGSGGPFRYHSIDALPVVSPAEACAHPNWSMGQKISVDSATMMNKGLEYIEAKRLFNTQPKQIEVIIHPQSIIHSMVQYCDGSVLAQMGQPDMATPIAHVMAYPQRITSGVEPLDFFSLGELSFIPPDFSRYPCLKLAIDACYDSQTATTCLNAANEIAVAAFLAGRIKFTQIAQVVAACLDGLDYLGSETELSVLLEVDQRARVQASAVVKRICG
ncbi:1-deoxy-D-xylulose-5-phosphate reductoisomerase [Agarivorans gilvus]|uniref:1-deoxy-D-xylulose-5-phosphate reductoisomerase n=1 Tax=Agarivorans gilvus TaxID=680279 RepID=UPI001669500A|nr:1-deoxy-D-xylulose-5-phosphate reductoisomerase [Agarivorans gilvus]